MPTPCWTLWSSHSDRSPLVRSPGAGPGAEVFARGASGLPPHPKQPRGLCRGLSKHPPCTDPAIPLRRYLSSRSQAGHHCSAGGSALRPRLKTLAATLQHVSPHASAPLRHLPAPTALHRRADAHEPYLPALDADGTARPPQPGPGAGRGPADPGKGRWWERCPPATASPAARREPTHWWAGRS